MSKYGMDGQGNFCRKNEKVGSITLQTNTSGIGNVSTPYGIRFRNNPSVVCQAYTTFSTYPGLTVVSSSTLFFDLKATLVGNVSRAFTMKYIAIDDGPFPG